MTDHDNPEAEALERTAEWRMRQADANPADTASIAAARHLQKLADELRSMPSTKLSEEYRCLFHWLSASDGITDLAQAAHRYNTAIGFGEWPESGEDYIRVLTKFANQLVAGN